MRKISTHRPLIVAMLVAVFAGCGSGGPSPAPSQWGASLEQIRGAVAAAGGYPPAAVEVTASPTRLRIAVADSSLAQADQITRENSASEIVSTAESVLPTQQFFASVQVISVAIIHPAAADGSSTQTHTEDVLEFRKGPNNRFAHHIT